MTATFTRSPIPLSDEARTRLVSALALSLCDGMAMYTCLKLAHWNVSGEHFASYHVLFGATAELVDGYNDDIAERVTTLGAFVGCNVSRVGATMRIADYPVQPMSAKQHLVEVSSRLDRYIAGLVAAADVAAEVEDEGTLNMLAGVLEQIQKAGWKVMKSLEPEEPSKDVMVAP